MASAAGPELPAPRRRPPAPARWPLADISATTLHLAWLVPVPVPRCARQCQKFAFLYRRRPVRKQTNCLPTHNGRPAICCGAARERGRCKQAQGCNRSIINRQLLFSLKPAPNRPANTWRSFALSCRTNQIKCTWGPS